ncbi:MAG TPA: hypothetical protein VKE50_12475 [Thermoanaerobaculia bacterium]|nr:hypothetical protein [Thermoanaerobaculia bacterium]
MPEPDAQRPTPVTVIGWVWMTLGMLVLGRSLVNIIIWRAIRPAFPLVASMVGHRPEGSEWIALLFEHFTAINVAHAVVAAGILLVAWQFLRLRSWARPALRLVCVLTLIYVACLGALMAAVFAGALPGSAVPASSAHSRHGLELVVWLAVCLAFSAGLATMIALLGSAAVRGAFRDAIPARAAASPV